MTPDPVDGAPAVSDWLSRLNLQGRPALWGRGPRFAQRADMASGLWMLAAALAALLLTLVLQALQPMVRTDSGQTMVCTATGLVGVLATIVFAGRVRVTRSLRDLLIVGSLGALSVTNLALAASPTPVSADPRSAWQWAVLLVGLIASVTLLAAVCWRVDVREPRSAARIPRRRRRVDGR